ncbi:hypothetical protein A2362_00800 [Candidatus Curtissbacteria bacterium RIFOXYB1_FULL_41_59]|uniref:Uncharacterized protein n=1 Tax=Candidatus Curtissbacteria bacterium RIFOXYA1_FULL_41_14 TaxID=1797737 RepID=A0A1F5HC47_9BACT|nr:MAG: hypothetical protein A2683_00110 [Candidatus Curtissbacteria bacterium RIFCSPHIGHO2_01_FULL_34_40]OGE01650.1 MAG: hypothetical protein A2196_02070 [Candidatus Curtissbacteria bacterium RIFOXYA1_FULL_41_14]OGE06169.1 MAG: hypothetical protein A2362_00800 [Candidatus Curtissbacteria bacterium RIFOXYB1_FULL_41_59]OGE08696.1 MAG: hypothetical protein A2615_04125 [Candidatus Curtissbacteria bacterium RIFOXYD1_FULL_41_36]OGE09880.1 MAG: hypothetical protein A2470_02185 [Candidatus Curtissbact
MKNGKWRGPCTPGGGAVYGLGLIGALVYFIQQSTTFGQGVLGVLKSIVWPAILVYKLLELLQL